MKTILITLIFFIIGIFLYDHFLLNGILPKRNRQYLRIGYINLHKSKVKIDDLKKIQKYDCDLWLFTEWNGDNFDAFSEFSKGYSFKFGIEDKKTYGFYILSKNRDVKITEIEKGRRNYTCNYRKYRIKHNNVDIFLVHAPPPVPACDMQTLQYIEDLISELKHIKGSNTNILVGDFNTLPFQSGIKKLNAFGYVDSYNILSKFPVGTFGFFTWFPKVLKLDYVFCKGNIKAKYAGRFSLSTSDHSGCVTDFELNGF